MAHVCSYGHLESPGHRRPINVPLNYYDNGERWSREHESDLAICEHEIVWRVLDAAATQGKLHLSTLASGEIMVRRLQLLEEAHTVSTAYAD